MLLQTSRDVNIPYFFNPFIELTPLFQVFVDLRFKCCLMESECLSFLSCLECWKAPNLAWFFNGAICYNLSGFVLLKFYFCRRTDEGCRLVTCTSNKRVFSSKFHFFRCKATFTIRFYFPHFSSFHFLKETIRAHPWARIYQSIFWKSMILRIIINLTWPARQASL